MTSGIYDLSATAYHADPCDEPSLSSSIAKVLCADSPRHAWAQHPRLNTAGYVREDSAAFDVGTAAHDIWLRGVDTVTVIEANDWRTNAAKEARDAAREAGKVPLLRHQAGSVLLMVNSLKAQLAEHVDGRAMFMGGHAERVIIWFDEEFQVWCRAMLDYLRPGAIDDLKTTGITANPEAVSRQFFTNGYDIQAAFYLRGLKAVTGEDADFRFAFTESTAPHCASVIGLSPAALVMGQKRVIYALDTWARCLKANDWPAYPSETCYVDVPAWFESSWLEKEMR